MPDVSTSFYVLHCNFARQAYKVQRQIGGGNGLVKEIDLVTCKWSQRGATEVRAGPHPNRGLRDPQ